jgi:parvulin-like peptidyl-prolyl isomerase
LKSVACLACLGALALSGCVTSSPPPADIAAPASAATPVSVSRSPTPPPGAALDDGGRIVATVAGEPITMNQLMPALIKAHGLTTLLQLVELDLAKQQAAQKHLTVTPADIEHERAVTLSHLFQQTDDKIDGEIEDAQSAHDTKRVKELQDELADQHAVLITQFLDNQHIAQSEFDTAMEINAYLRKIAEPTVKAAITDDVLHHAFNQQYGERVRVRYIQLHNMQQVAQVHARLKAGDDFGDIARDMSENVPSRELGGELPPFSEKDTNYPLRFRQAAFALKPGEISDPVEYENALYLIKMEQRIAPVAVKFDDVKDSLRAMLTENLTQQAIRSLRERLGALAIQEMQIVEPIMAKQYADRKAQQEAQVRDQQRIKEEMDLEHKRLWGKIDAATQPATEPASPETQP